MSKREQEIIAAAAKVFKEKGYHAATTRDIAAEVGIQQAALYYYISSKDERAIHAHLAAFDENYPHMFVYVQELPNLIDTLQGKIRESPAHYQHLWEAILQQG